MAQNSESARAAIPSVDRLLRLARLQRLVKMHGRPLVADATRTVLDDLRRELNPPGGRGAPGLELDAVARRIAARVEEELAPSLRRVFNLTGTVLHTNLGRASLPADAIEAVTAVAGGASNLEFELGPGRRGERDDHIATLLCRLTGAEAATVVNNNAAAVLLLLNTLALRKEVPVSRGELIEIGGAFRIPDIMARAGCKLREVGTTNRTHLRDFAAAIGPRTALLMSVHTSNYAIQGFTAAAPQKQLAALAHEHGLPYVVDLGSGTLIDLARFGLPHEPTPQEAIADGADLVTFSGDKLLGGPQAGLIVGRRDLVDRIRRNPLKRALRLDKMTIAALAAVLRLYLDPDRLADRLPTLRALARPVEEIEAAAKRLQPPLASSLAAVAAVSVETCRSQIGSGALPIDLLPSAALVVRPATARGAGTALKRIAGAFRRLPEPVIGRMQDDAFWLDLRCLPVEEEARFLGQLGRLEFERSASP